MQPSRRELVGAGAALAGLASCARGASEGPDAAAVRAAEQLLGVDFTNAERDQMIGVLEGQLDVVRALRAETKPNSLAPAMTFDPRVPGVVYPNGPDVPFAPPDVGSPPADETDIAFAPAYAQARWIANGALSSRALTEICLDRIERIAPQLECFVTVMADQARAEADAADAELAARGPKSALHGLPYGLKDLFDAEGAPTTWGAMPYKDRPPATADSAVAAKLRAAGAVLIGKTTLGALAYGDIWFGGRTRNPWNTAEGSSGSSAGSAAGVAAGLMSFAIGTETLGSIVSPSDRCGTTGLRPTFGRVSRHGAMALCWSLDKIGPLARSVADAALVLEAITGFDPRDASSFDAPLDLGDDGGGGADARGLTVGYDPRWFEDAHPLDLVARDAMAAAGARLVEITAPEVPADPLFLALTVEAAAAFEDLTLSDADDQMVWQDDDAWPNSFRAARFISAIDYVQIDRVRRRLMTEMHGAFAGVDVLIGPNYAGGMLTATNFTGQPQLALRAGFAETPSRTLFDDAQDGQGEGEEPPLSRTPRAISLWAPLFGEGLLVRAGRALEAQLGVAGERPPTG
ncbi:MAG: amidase [Maricaulaceae bacterium]|jgi:Asp-tRNA(Asn)/Glu-tRNA(Gln) amidotransferase A subunit family amidase